MVQNAEWWSMKDIFSWRTLGCRQADFWHCWDHPKSSNHWHETCSEFSTSQLGGCFNKWNAKIWKNTATKNIWTCNSINSLWWKLVKENNNNTQLSTNFQVNLLCWIVSSLSLVGLVRWSSIRLLHPTSNSTKNVSPKNVFPISLSLSLYPSLHP